MKFDTKKSLGQNFIFDDNILKKISKLIKSQSNNQIIEIGSGLGTLTKHLFKKDFNKLILLEKDIRLINNLEKNFLNKNVYIFNIDALNFDFQKSSINNSIIVGNLPFNISVDLIYLLTKSNNWPPKQIKMILMFQKEVAERIVALPNSKSYGKLSVVIQSRFKIKKALNLPASVFLPVPKVDATILEFTPFDDFGSIDISKIDEVSKAAFSQRRKKIKNNMSDYIQVIRKLSIDSNLRPENLSVFDYCNIAKNI